MCTVTTVMVDLQTASLETFPFLTYTPLTGLCGPGVGPPFRRSAIPTCVWLTAHRRRHGKMCDGVLGVHHSQNGAARYSQLCTLELLWCHRVRVGCELRGVGGVEPEGRTYAPWQSAPGQSAPISMSCALRPVIY